MSKTNNRQRLLASTMIGGIAAMALAAAPAYAQNRQDPDAEELEEVVVVGSRLARTQDFEAISPVTTVTSEALQMTGTLTVESLLNELPQVVAGNMRTSNNSGGEDFATVDLRGLGASRTLVIINGERLPASSTTGVVDLNTIPASLVSRVEVVTGGASAVYGSDAVSGVVNFVLKDDYEGAELGVSYGSSFEGKAPEFEINGLFGGNFADGRGNLTAYASYYSRSSVSQSEFDWSRNSGTICTNDAALTQLFVCDTAADALGSLGSIYAGGSATAPWGSITNRGPTSGLDATWNTADDNPGNPFGGFHTVLRPGPDGILGTSDDLSPLQVPNTGLAVALPGRFGAGTYDTNCDGVANTTGYTGGNLSFNDAGQLTPLQGAGACAVADRGAGSSRYNFAPDNYLILPAERFTISTIGTYDINDDVSLRVMINYTNSWQQVSLAPTPTTGLTVTLTPAMQTLIQANAPDLWTALQTRPAPLAPFAMAYRTNQLGSRLGDNENSSLMLLGTLTGSINENWDWSFTTSYGSNTVLSSFSGSANKTAMAQGLAGCQTAAGAPLGVSMLPGCVPLDIFGPGTLTPAMISFITVPTFTSTKIEESRIAGFVRGNLFELPAGPIAAVFGAEWRESAADLRVDNEQRTGNIYGFNAAQNQAGRIGVSELYTEVAVPLLADLPFANYLGLEAGYRMSDYTTVGTLSTYKIGAEWEPVDWLRLRAIYNEATRAPSVFELFQNGDQGFPGYTDPCATIGGVAPSVAMQTFCAGQNGGFSYAAFTQPNTQVEAFSFGNPNLTPEEAETFTAGFVFQPDFWPIGSFRMAVDYYNIEIADFIGSFSAQSYINSCYNNMNPANPNCARIVRDPVSGEIDYVNTTRGNQGVLKTVGYDLNASWSLDLGPGRLRLQELFSWVDEISVDGDNFVDTTNAGIGGANYQWRSVFTSFYDVSDWTFMARWSYTPGMIDNTFGTSPDLRTPEASYIDVSARWGVTDNMDLTAFVGNVLDENPPQTVSGAVDGGQANTDPQVYRLLGRTFSVNLRARF